jgi:hypothetical protein
MLMEIAATNDKHRTVKTFFLKVSSPRLAGSPNTLEELLARLNWQN